MYTFENLNQALIGLSKEILKVGVKRETRGFNCIEFPEPVSIKITNPTDRYVTIPIRKWNSILPFAESIWILLGMNDLDSLPGIFVKNLYNFSDNGRTWRAGYGPRIRRAIGFDCNYDVSTPLEFMIYSGKVKTTDQLKYVIECFKKDINTRQAVIEIADPVKDNFGEKWKLKETKDQPCTRLLNFQVRDNKLDLTVYLRSNDLIWGFSAVNVFNFTFLQEIVAAAIGLPIGDYYHVANNLHFYEDKLDMVKELASLNIEEYKSEIKYEYNSYNNSQKSLEDIDYEFTSLFKNIHHIINGGNFNNISPMTDDWQTVFYNHFNKENQKKFNNPMLNKLFKIR